MLILVRAIQAYRGCTSIITHFSKL